MDPVTAAIAAAVAALAAGTVKSAGQVGEKVLADAYESFKGLLRRKFGAESQVVKAVAEVETKPTSQWPKGMLQEAVAETRADQDLEVRAAAEKLLEQVKKEPGGEQVVQQVIGSTNVAQAAFGGSANVTVGQAGESSPPKP